MADDDLEIGIEMVDKTGTATSSVVSNAQKITSEYEKAGQAVDEFSLKAAAANQRAANSFASLAKSNQSGKNSWYNPSASDAANMQAAQTAAASAAAAKSQIADAAAIKAAEDKRYQSLVSTRYALYDVASTYRQVSVAAIATVAAVVGTGMSFEDAFTGVERTADLPIQKLEELRQQLVGLSTEIPVAFTNLSEIATLGGQLGIAGESLTGFAQSVAEFSATTNASIDATATGFGRIAQLTDAGTGSFDKIGSAIYTVGVNSVATETEIMKVAQEISTAGNLAGFSTANIIGLSGALASLGVQPERARGNIQRIFAEINSGITDGGEALQAFSTLSGLSATEFATQWKNAPAETFTSLIDGLGRAAAGGQNLDTILTSLGIKAVRDVQTMKQLADNTDLLHQTMSDANAAYTAGTSLQEAYGSVADNLSSKLETLKNTIQAILDNISNNKVLGFFVGQLQGLLGAVNNLLNILGPVGDVFGALVLSGTLAIGVYTLMASGIMSLRAGYMAMITAQQNLAKSGTAVDLSLKNMLKTILTLNSAVATGTTTLNGMATAASRTSASVGGVSTGAAAATSWVGKLGSAFKGMGLVAVADVGLQLFGKALEAVNHAMESSSQKAGEWVNNWSGLSDALKEDQATYQETGAALGKFQANVSNASTATPEWVTSLEMATGAQTGLVSSTNEATDAVQKQTLIVGQATAQWFANTLATSTQFQEIWKNNGAALEAAGFNFQEFLQAMMSGEGGGMTYLDAQLDSINGQLDTLGKNTDVSTEQWLDQNNALYDAVDGLNRLKEFAKGTSDELADQAFQTDFTNKITQALGITADDTADDMYNLGAATEDLYNQMFAGMDASAAFQDALFNLGGSIAENGNDFSVYTEQGRANLSALQTAINAAAKLSGDDAAALANNLAVIANSLGTFGVNVQAQLPQLMAQASAGLKNAKSLGTYSASAGYATKQTELFTASSKKAASAAAAQAKKVYTLSDYVNDLSSVIKKAFDFRFGLDQSTDDLADAFQKLVDMKQDAQDAITDAFSGLEDAQKNVRDLRVDLQGLQADLNGLYADQGTLQYQLGVAIDYGDTLRQNEIMAELKKNSADIASKQNDMTNKSKDLGDAQNDVSKATSALSKAQQDAVRTLDGGTASSREQRAAVLDLVQSYQDQVVALANTGMNQQQLQAETEKLRQQFVAQMKQLGYNSTEIANYSQSFTNLITVINAVPRNITISANADPARRAINEFIAANTNGRGASSPINTPITSSFNDAGVQKAARAQELLGQISRWQSEYTSAMASGNAMRIRGANYTLQAINQYSARLRSGNYYNGGFTGRGGTREIAGVAHKGEWIARQNQTDQNTGLPYPSVLASLLASYGYGSHSSASTGASFPSIMVVELSPIDRQLLKNAGSQYTVIGDNIIASATDRYNSTTSRTGR